MGTVVTKSFKIKTENGFSDPINFLSESVFFQDGKNLDSHLESLDNKIDTEIQDRKNAITEEAQTRAQADTTLDSKINTEIQDRIAAVSGEKSARESADSTLDTKINTETQKREDADTALTNSINTLNTTLTNNINSVSSTLTDLIDAEGRTRETAISAEKTARETEDTVINGKIQTLTENLNTETSQRKESVSTLKATVEENTKNISSLEDFIIGENKIEENASPLVDQVTTNASAIEALKLVTGKDTLEEGASSLLEMITSLEARIAILEGKITFYIDNEKYQVEEGTTWFNFAAENGLNCASLEDHVWDETYNVRVFDVEENNYVIGETIIIKDKNYTWLADQ